MHMFIIEILSCGHLTLNVFENINVFYNCIDLSL